MVIDESSPNKDRMVKAFMVKYERASKRQDVQSRCFLLSPKCDVLKVANCRT
jgi:hypothetical protein